MQTLKERRRKISRRLIRKYNTIEDPLFSIQTAVIFEEELGQFNNLFQMLLSVHEECNGLLHEEEGQQDMNGLMILMHKHFYSKGKYMSG